MITDSIYEYYTAFYILNVGRKEVTAIAIFNQYSKRFQKRDKRMFKICVRL